MVTIDGWNKPRRHSRTNAVISALARSGALSLVFEVAWRGKTRKTRWGEGGPFLITSRVLPTLPFPLPTPTSSNSTFDIFELPFVHNSFRWNAVHSHNFHWYPVSHLYFNTMSGGLIPALGGLLGGSSALEPITDQERTILGPLTTTFTQPPQCTTAAAEVSGQTLLGQLAQVCGPEGGAIDTSCWPPTSGAGAGPATHTQGLGFYSPGISCPAGHTSACSATAGLFGKTEWPLQYTLSASETAVGCCPG